MLEQYQSYITKYAKEFNVPESWVKAVIMTESSGDPRAVGSDPDPLDRGYGLMQIILRTARGLGYTGTVEGLFDVDTNIRLGTKLLGQLRERWGDDIKMVYSAYNSGAPLNYTTNPQVASNVSRLLNHLEAVLKSEPFIAASGAVGALIIAVLVWYWSKRGKK